MKRKAIWEGTVKEKVRFPSLKEYGEEADVVIIGAGLTGLTTALLLKESGKSVVVIEARKIGESTSGLSSCHLTTDIDEEYRHISENFDLSTASLVAESRMSAIDYIENTVEKHSLDCDFKRVPGYLYTEIPEDISSLKEEFAYASQAGLNVKLLNSAPLPFEIKKAVRFENQAEFNSAQYLQGLSKLVSNGMRIFEQSPVREIQKNGDHFIVKSQSGSILARQVVMATHLPLFFNVLQSLSSPYISYMLAAKLRTPEYGEGLYWDTADPYHYTRYYQKGEENYVIVGGGDHKTGSEHNTTKKFLQLEKYVRSRFNISSIDYKWSAQYYEPADGLPYIGKSPFSKNLFVATGFSGDGLVYGTIAAMIISDLIMGKENQWHKVYDSTRFTPAVSAAEFIKENTDVARHFIADRIKADDENDFSDLKAGEGRVVRVDGSATAVSRDENNQLHSVSAVCPHLKCLVNWNTFEQTWDCPCHGSRFEADGKVIYGPSTNNLKPQAIPQEEKIDKRQEDK